MTIVLTSDERESLFSLLTEQQRTFIQEHVKRGKKTVFANQMAIDKGIILPESASIDEIEMLLDEWILEDYIDNGFVNPETPCECGRPLRYQYIVKHKSTKQLRRFGITHFEEHTGIPGELVNAIIKGFTTIDYEMDELLDKIRQNWTLEEVFPSIPREVVLPTDISDHLENNLPLLERQIKRLRLLINEFLSKRELERSRVIETPPSIIESSETDDYTKESNQFTFEFELFEDTEDYSPVQEKRKILEPVTNHLSAAIKDKVLHYLETVSSVRIICELLIKHHIVAGQRYITGKPKIYPIVCLYLESLVNENVIYLEEVNGTDDRKYKFTKNR
ncbi:DUF3895 domain-containing protein [Neobacillus citreus]|uniref:DUF3895 domain-containing protein n=1 Tax=Neobacillus citreus TaxID=2833578 RepID=A0A942YBH5_9BACI|nr:DUF3895 domain-containing protein [Neobacillus citreus]MCH6268809.1 DUF3895 domain-containing protein [Neobacillus citreus]